MRLFALTMSVLAALSCAPPRDARQPEQPPHLSQADLARDAGEQRAERHSHHAHDAARRDLAAKTSLSPAPAADSDAELARRVDDDLGGLGCLSLGRPNAGALLNGKPFPEGDNWEVLDPTRAFATQETIDYLKTAIASVAASHGVVHKLIIGHLSREHGGPIRPHRSHQSGRDVDLSYYYRPEKAEWYRPATEGTLDLDRSWAFVRALVTETDVEMILIDIRVQRLLKEHALSLGEDREWLDSVFQFRGRGGEPIIRHAFGHRTHIHVRFYNPRAQDLGHRVFDQLTKRDIIKPRHYTVRYRARPGDNLDVLAAKAGTSVTTIGRMNGIKRGEMRAGQTYLVPMRGRVARVTNVAIPPRRLPPLESGIRSRGVAAAADAPL